MKLSFALSLLPLHILILCALLLPVDFLTQFPDVGVHLFLDPLSKNSFEFDKVSLGRNFLQGPAFKDPLSC